MVQDVHFLSAKGPECLIVLPSFTFLKESDKSYLMLLGSLASLSHSGP
jgi:hypothetical protein